MSDKEEIKKEEPPKEDWMTKKWRPMMAIMYMTCCLMDFAIFPIMFTIVQFWETQAANDAFRQWVPITLQGGGLFHVAMGAVLGVSAYGRTQEKVAGAAGNAQGTPVQQLPMPQTQQTSYGQPVRIEPRVDNFFSQPQPQPVAYNQQYGGNNNQIYNPPGQVMTGYGGKLRPPPAEQPLL